MSYRNDVEALQIKLSQLEDERAAIQRDRVRLADSLRRLPRVDEELDRLRREIHARAPRRLPVLEDIRVASPCHARWDDMTGDEQARFCSSCKKNVFNLSAMTREEAEALVRAKEGDLCVRFYRRADGTVLTADCTVGVRRKRVQLVAAAGAVTALAAGAAAMAFGRGAPAPVVESTPVAHLVQGGAAPPVVSAPPEVAPPPVSELGQVAVQGGAIARPIRPRMGRPMMRHDR